MNVFLKGLFAGICIAMGSVIYMNEQGIVGPVLFATGLLSIFTLNLYLYTGQVPYGTRWKEIPFLLTVLVSNIIGCCITYIFPSPVAVDIINQKLSEPYLYVFIQAILCNALIYVACEANKQNKNLSVIFAVTTFILCGFEHSIANVCFFASARVFNMDVVIHTLIVVLGNAVGGLLTRQVHIGLNENSKDRKRLFE